jgi:hypothetical protein
MTLPDIVVQEIRNTLALHCRDIVMANKADGEKSDKQALLVGKCFHGTESHASVLKLFMEGRGLYENIYEKVEIEPNRAGNDDRGKEGVMLMLLDIIHCDPGKTSGSRGKSRSMFASRVFFTDRLLSVHSTGAKYAVHDPGFNWDTIAKNKGELVTGRNLQERALTAIHNYKFALKFSKEFLDSRQNTPSGCKLPDLLLYVRQKMFVEFRGCRNKPSASQGKRGLTEEDMEQPLPILPLSPSYSSPCYLSITHSPSYCLSHFKDCDCPFLRSFERLNAIVSCFFSSK